MENQNNIKKFITVDIEETVTRTYSYSVEIKDGESAESVKTAIRSKLRGVSDTSGLEEAVSYDGREKKDLLTGSERVLYKMW